MNRSRMEGGDQRLSRQTYTEVTLEVDHLLLNQRRLKHGNGRLLEGMGSTTIEVATARADAMPQSVFISRLQNRIVFSLRRDVFYRRG